MSLLSFYARNSQEVLGLVGQHVYLVAISTGAAIVIGVPLGVLLTRRPGWRGPVLGVANVFQTVPSLALFGFLIPLPFIGGIGARTAIVALVLYALLPIVRNTYEGIAGVDPAVREAGRGMGMTDWQLLAQVELPLGFGVILAGVRVATVVSVGTANLPGRGGGGRYADPRRGAAGRADGARGGRAAGSRGAAVRVAGEMSPHPLSRCFGLLALLLTGCAQRDRIVVGSKNFTESDLLGEIVAQQIERRTALPVERRFHLGGTFVCHQAITSGQIDLYVEYTGTAYTAVLKRAPVADRDSVYRTVARDYAQRFGLAWGEPFGFNNTFAITVRRRDATRDGLKHISDLARVAPRWKAGFGYEFLERADGFRGLASVYGLRFAAPPTAMDLGLTYRALAEGKVDVIAGNSTDGQIQALDLLVLEDDRHYFPPYEAAPVIRQAALTRHPEIAAALAQLAGKISDAEMRRLNALADVEHRDIATIARDWLRATLP